MLRVPPLDVVMTEMIVVGWGVDEVVMADVVGVEVVGGGALVVGVVVVVVGGGGGGGVDEVVMGSGVEEEVVVMMAVVGLELAVELEELSLAGDTGDGVVVVTLVLVVLDMMKGADSNRGRSLRPGAMLATGWQSKKAPQRAS